MKKQYLLFALCSLLFVSACTFQTKQRGYIFPEDTEPALAEIKTVSQLEEMFGSPQARTVYGKPVWIYYGADENYHGPFPLTWDNRKVLLVWTDGGRITASKILKDEDLPRMSVADGSTPIPAEIQLNVFEELINNIGRFTPAGLGQ